MNNLQRAVRYALAIVMLVTVFAVYPVSSEAQGTITYPTTFTRDVNECYFAAVSNGEQFGLGPARTSLTIQNLGTSVSMVFLLYGGSTGFINGDYTTLQPGASKTFSAESLGIPAGTTAPVIVASYDVYDAQSGSFALARRIPIGCFAKQAVDGLSLPNTTTTDTAVSGYNATSGREVGIFSKLYLPIVQTNCGPGGCWNTKLRVANVGINAIEAVKVNFYAADNAATGLGNNFQVTAPIDRGRIWTIDLTQYMPSGWVGSAQIEANGNIVAIADRYKPGTHMWITNTAAAQVAPGNLNLPGGPVNAPYILYAPDVRLDFSGWNSGISITNTVDESNNVTIRYFGPAGSAPATQEDSLNGFDMTYFYNPASPADEACPAPVLGVATCDWVGGAIILSSQPVAAAIDAVKYYGSSADAGHAYGYTASGAAHRTFGVPLVQKGSPTSGLGATSGLTFLNPNDTGTFAAARWIKSNGDSNGTSTVWLPPHATGFIYTMSQATVETNSQISAIVSSELPIVGATTNADYAVGGDGTAFWTLYNPCGQYLQRTGCLYNAEPEALATKTFDITPAPESTLICAFTDADGTYRNTAHCTRRYVPDFEVAASGLTDTFIVSLTEFTDSGLLPVRDTWAQVGINRTITTVEVSMYEGGTRNLFTPSIARWSLNSFKPTAGSGTVRDLTCSQLATISDVGELNVFGPLSNRAVSDSAITAMGNPRNAVVLFEIDGGSSASKRTFCGELQTGQLRLETAFETRTRMGLSLPPFGIDVGGEAVIDLPAGCYYFVVSADGYHTDRSGRECFNAGQTKTNEVTLISSLPPTPSPTGTAAAATQTANALATGTARADAIASATASFVAATASAVGATQTAAASATASVNASMTFQFCRSITGSICTDQVSGLMASLYEREGSSWKLIAGPTQLSAPTFQTGILPFGEYQVCWESTTTMTEPVEKDCLPYTNSGGGGANIGVGTAVWLDVCVAAGTSGPALSGAFVELRRNTTVIDDGTTGATGQVSLAVKRGDNLTVTITHEGYVSKLMEPVTFATGDTRGTCGTTGTPAQITQGTADMLITLQPLDE